MGSAVIVKKEERRVEICRIEGQCGRPPEGEGAGDYGGGSGSGCREMVAEHVADAAAKRL